MRKLGKFLTKDLNEDGNVLWVDSLAMIPGSGGERGKFDIIILGYVLQEVSSAKGRLLVIEALWSRLKDEGVIIVVEPGSPKGFRYINAFRDWVLAKDRKSASIIGPCPHHGQCPMAKHPDLWCHFSQITQKIPNTVFPKRPAEPDTVNEKYSYLIVQKNAETPNTKYENIDQAKTAVEKSYFWPRIIRPAIGKHKHIILDLCTKDSGKTGQLQRRVIAKSHGIEGGYRMAKRMKWGDLWYFKHRVPNKFRKEGRFGKRLW
jgi:ribosomal protein RSM22 (predicted rRNA methylase)